MVADEKMLEELYELLGLYFQIKTGSELIKPTSGRVLIEPQLDRIIFREKLLAKITTLIVEEFLA